MLLKADAVSLCNGQKNNNDLNIYHQERLDILVLDSSQIFLPCKN